MVKNGWTYCDNMTFMHSRIEITEYTAVQYNILEYIILEYIITVGRERSTVVLRICVTVCRVLAYRNISPFTVVEDKQGTINDSILHAQVSFAVV